MRLLLVLSLAQALRAPLDRRRTLTTRSYGQQQDANDKLPEMRAPEEGKQVRMFGAKLDAGFAGTRASNPKVIRAVLKAYDEKKDTEGSYASNDEQAEIFYASAVEKMNKGFYDDAVKRLNRASYFAGVASRRGGQMQLWLGQALYAAGRRGDALKLLLALKAHPDRDVAKVSKELVFILKAPELQLDESSRVGFDMDNFDAEAKFERAPDGTIKIMKRPEFEKPPEYGSVRSRRPAVPSRHLHESSPGEERLRCSAQVEWVLQPPRGEPPVGNDVDPVAVGGVLALCVGALALCR